MFGKEKIVKAIMDYEYAKIPIPQLNLDDKNVVAILVARVNALEKLIKDLREAFS